MYLRSNRASLRISMLGVIFGASLSIWVFVASSLVFCEVYDYLYPASLLDEVKVVTGWATILALGLGIPVAVLVSLRTGGTVLRNATIVDPPAPLLTAFREVGDSMGVRRARLIVVDSKNATCFSIGGDVGRIVVSRNLTHYLDGEGLRSILAHEFAHLKNGDTPVKALLAVYSKILRFDPIIRLVSAAAQREMECRADERVVRLRGERTTLIEALLRLDSLKRSPQKVPSFAMQLLASHPPMRVRVRRLRELDVS